MNELKPCPFCGGEAKIDKSTIPGLKEPIEVEAEDLFYVECKQCGCQTEWYNTESEAVVKWNTRPARDKRERLAEYAHNAWSGWMKYMFSKSTINEDGTLTIPQWAVERWQRQMNTPYNELLEEEKASDRHEADLIIDIATHPTTSQIVDAVMKVIDDADVRIIYHDGGSFESELKQQLTNAINSLKNS